MNVESKLIQSKLGLLKLAEKLGNVQRLAVFTVTAVIAFTESKNSMIQAAQLP